jgi:hypothetical protein
MPQPILKFRISVRFKDIKLNCPVLFYIWANDKDLAKYHGHSYYAVTLDRSMVSTGKTIEVHLSADRMSLGYVCHEVFHMVVFWANRHNLEIQKDSPTYTDEERCASLHGAIVKKFYEKLYRLNYIESADFVTSKKYPHYKLKEII